jgi:hypothetical protein
MSSSPTPLDLSQSLSSSSVVSASLRRGAARGGGSMAYHVHVTSFYAVDEWLSFPALISPSQIILEPKYQCFENRIQDFISRGVCVVRSPVPTMMPV